MADNQDDLMDEVRQITDYDAAVLPDGDLKTVIATSQREVEGVADTTIEDWYGTRDAELALFWTTCLFCKVKAGELDGVSMSLGDMETEALRAAGEGRSDKPVIWYERATAYAQRLMSTGGRFGHRSVSRRTYGEDASNNTTL